MKGKKEQTLEVQELADAVVNYRARHNMSMQAFADMCGVCWQTIWNLETNNYQPQRTTQAKIKMVLEQEVL